MKGPLAGPLMAALAVTFFSINDVVIKLLSTHYALHLVVLIRSLLALSIVLLIMVPLSGGLAQLRTQRLGEHVIRGLCVVLANMMFFLGLTTLEMADAVAIFFVAPLLITVLSVVFLKETVGPRRWTAVALGFIGVLIVMRPGTNSFELAMLLPLIAACAYATIHIFSRRLGSTESAVTMAFYIQVVFIAACIGFGAVFGSGWLDNPENATLSFLFRAWSLPAPGDLWAFAAIGIATAAAGFLISNAYKHGEAALVAPFEYIALPLSIFWGLTVFGTRPDPVAWPGIALILGSGLYIAWRENLGSRGS